MGVSLVSPDELRKLIACSEVQVVDVRPSQAYKNGHIPGAISIRWEDWSAKPPSHVRRILTKPGYWGTLADPQEDRIGERLADAGLNREIPIVVYADGRLSKGREGRVAWMLLYFGAANVSLLDGGWTKWVELNHPVEIQIPQKTTGCFDVAIVPNRRIMVEQVIEKLNGDQPVCLLDTRTEPEFQGLLYQYQPRMGHIPGAHLLPFDSMFQDDTHDFVTAETYAALLPQAASNATIIAYCEVGVRAATVAMLHEIYTGDIMPVYDGSLMEWALDDQLPVSTGAKQD